MIDDTLMKRCFIYSVIDDLKLREDKCIRLQNELRHLQESLAIQLSSPSRFVETNETAIKERIREILSDNKEKHCVRR